MFHNKAYQGAVHVIGTLSQESLVFKFDNKIEYFEFLVEAKNLIENKIWSGFYFTSSYKVGAKGIDEFEKKCLEYAIDINKRTQEILDKYIEKNNPDTSREEAILLDIMSKTSECLNNLNKLGKLTKIL